MSIKLEVSSFGEVGYKGILLGKVSQLVVNNLERMSSSIVERFYGRIKWCNEEFPFKDSERLSYVEKGSIEVINSGKKNYRYCMTSWKDDYRDLPLQPTKRPQGVRLSPNKKELVIFTEDEKDSTMSGYFGSIRIMDDGRIGSYENMQESTGELIRAEEIRFGNSELFQFFLTSRMLYILEKDLDTQLISAHLSKLEDWCLQYNEENIPVVVEEQKTTTSSAFGSSNFEENIKQTEVSEKYAMRISDKVTDASSGKYYAIVEMPSYTNSFIIESASLENLFLSLKNKISLVDSESTNISLINRENGDVFKGRAQEMLKFISTLIEKGDGLI